jgi:hypothetical protein
METGRIGWGLALLAGAAGLGYLKYRKPTAQAETLGDGKTFSITFPGAYQQKTSDLGESYERGGYLETHYRFLRMQSAMGASLEQEATRFVLGIHLSDPTVASAARSCPSVRGVEVHQFDYRPSKGERKVGCLGLVRTPDRAEVLVAAVYPTSRDDAEPHRFLQSFDVRVDSSGPSASSTPTR